VQLIEALGGGWDASQLPTPEQIVTEAPAAAAPAAPAQSSAPAPKPNR